MVHPSRSLTTHPHLYCLILPSHRRRGATAVLVRHKPQCHRHDRRGSAVVSSFILPFTIYHQGFFHSVRRNPSLNCFHRRRSLAIIGHAVPRWRTRLSLHLVLGLPCRLVHYRGVHSVTLLVHLLSLKRAMCPAHPCIPFLITSMMSFTPV